MKPWEGRARRLLCGPAPVLAILSAFLATGLSAANRESPTFDEGQYILAGCTYWKTGDYRLFAENGNWVMRWEALPAWLAGYKLPPLDGQEWKEAQSYSLADQFLYRCGNDAGQLVMGGRLMVAVLSAALGLLVYLWSRSLFGPYGGLLSLTLYVLSPAILSNGFLATSDLAVTLCFAAATWSVWAALHRVSLWTLGASSLSLAALFLVKFSAVIILPIGLLLLTMRLSIDKPLSVTLRRAHEVYGFGRQLAVFAGVGVLQVAVIALAIWASFGFRYAMETTPWNWAQVQDTGGVTSAAIGLAVKYHLLPQAYLGGFRYQVTTTEVRRCFLNGRVSSHGFRTFFPYCFAVKTPLPTFVLLGVAGWIYWTSTIRKKRGLDSSPANSPATGASSGLPDLYELTPVLSLLGTYWVFALVSHLNIGLRHLLPTYPPMFVLAGAAALCFQGTGAAQMARSLRLWLARSAIIAALLINAVEVYWCWPNYLAYFNLLAGGPSQAYRHLVDSSLDWGQDLEGLKSWLEKDPQAAADPERVYLSYFGSASPEYYGVKARPLSSFAPWGWEPTDLRPLTGGVYCASATRLQGVNGSYPGRWNRTYEDTYQALRLELNRQARTADADPQPAPGNQRLATDAQLRDAFHQLQWGRLRAFLRKREPDDNVGHSILIYRLTDEDVRMATEGFPVEMLNAPEEVQ
jgi:hypothetical protein